MREKPTSSWLPAALCAVIAAGAAVRFATLGMQSYHHDEAWTAGVVLHAGLFKTLGKVASTESTPPLYYVLAWVWSKLFGTGEWGLRSLSALFGLATIPVCFAIGRRLAGDLAGLGAAALAAVNPAMVWYSQEARSYALLVLLSALALLFFLRAREGFATRDLAGWALLSALAIATHYFGAVPALIEAALLLAAAGPRLRAAAAAAGGAAAVGLALLPLAIHQDDAGHAAWIARIALPTRLKETAVTFTSGETGRVIVQPLHARYAWLPLALMALAAGIVAWRGLSRERRAAGLALLIAAGTLALPLVAAAAGRDFVLGRNLLPALVPLLLVVAIGLGCRRAGRLGVGVGVALIAYWLAFAVYVDMRPRLQRPEWRQIAADIGRASGPREIVTSGQGMEPLKYYLPGRAVELRAPRPPIAVDEVDVVSVGRPPATPALGLPSGFAPAGETTEQTVTLTRFRSRRPVAVRWHELVDHYTGQASRDVIGQDLDAAPLPISEELRAGGAD